MEYFRTGEALSMGWGKFKAHKVFLWMLLGILIVSQALFGVLEEVTKDMGLFSTVISVGTSLLTMFINLGFIRLYLDVVDSDVEGRLSTLFSSKPLFWSYLGASILFFLIVGLGFLLLIIPGIYFMLKYQFYGELIVDKKLGVIEALKKSGEITKGVKWRLLGFSLAVIGVNVLGVLALGIGILVTIPLTTMAYIGVYRKLSLRLNGPTETAVSAPVVSPSTENVTHA